MELKKGTKVKFAKAADGVNPDLLTRRIQVGATGQISFIPRFNTRGQVEVKLDKPPHPMFQFVVVDRDALTTEGGGSC